MKEKAWHQGQDGQRNLATRTEELEKAHTAQVIYKSAVRATLYGRDP